MVDMEEEPLLKPMVLWAQRKEMVLLRVKIQPTEKPDFKIHDTHMEFKGVGIGASGKNWYGFELVFYESVDTKRCRVRFHDNEIEFRLLKINAGPWPRLQSTHNKPHWISLDFDHFEVSESEEEKDSEETERVQMQKQLEELEKSMQKQVDLYESVVNVAEKIKVFYLLMYNLLQWVGFSIVVGMLLYLLKDGTDGIYNAYEVVSPVLNVCQLLAFLEVIHSMFGLVKGGVLASLMQVAGRAFILFLCLSPVKSMHTHPIVYVLFMVWSLIELFRYPYYALSVLNKDIYLLSWLRYTVWIPLYPTGFTCEAIVIWLSIQYSPPEGVWSYPLPNALNMSFSVIMFQKMVLLLYPIFPYLLISYMFSQRKKKLSSKMKKQ